VTDELVRGDDEKQQRRIANLEVSSTHGHM
jgi:hypothetical protein